MKLFGKELFGVKEENRSELYDFAKHGLIRDTGYIEISDVALMASSDVRPDLKKKAEKPKKPKPTKTPKEVYQLESLNDTEYNINTGEEYISKHVKSLEKKLALLVDPDAKKNGRRGREEAEIFVENYGASKFGRQEMQSMIDRLNNRRHFDQFKDFFSQYPYTTSALMNDVLQEHTNLRSKRVEEFIPDLPDEAIEVMDAYNKKVIELTGKKAVFYIIADRKDFGEVARKRDPILLAQSPFALSWQVLGAWDEEMVYLGDL